MKIKINDPIVIINVINGLPITDDDQNIVSLDFKTFMKTIVFVDARWDLSLHHIKMFMNVVDKTNNSNYEMV